MTKRARCFVAPREVLLPWRSIEAIAAAALGAVGLIGTAFDYEEMAEGMLWVNLSGTVVDTRRE